MKYCIATVNHDENGNPVDIVDGTIRYYVDGVEVTAEEFEEAPK